MPSARLYRWLLRLFPEEFRLDYGAEMEAAFREQYRDRGAAVTWTEAIPDLTLTAWREHVDLLLQDFRYSVRLLSKSRMLTFVAVLSVALAIGANSAMFSVVYTSLLRPLPYRDAGRLVMLWGSRTDDRSNRNGLAVPDFQDYRRFNAESPRGAFEQLELFGGDRWANIQSDGRADRAQLQYVSRGFFDMLGAKPVLGRFFTEDELARGVRNATISYGYWQRRYNGSRDVLGKSIAVNGAVSQIIGVLPRDFGTWDDRVDVWLPLVVGPAAPATSAGRKVLWQICIARLRPGVKLAEAQAQMDAIAGQLAASFPETNHNRAVFVQPLGQALRHDLPDMLLPLFGAVAFVLLIACTNVTNLLLARAASRRGEIALRAAIGAGRVRLMRQLLMDGMVLAIPAGLLGLAAAKAGILLFKATVPEGFAYLDRVELDWRVALFTTAVAVLVGTLMGLVPALQFSRPDLTVSLKAARGSGGRGHRGRSLLVVGQIALAGLLLSGAVITLSALRNLYGSGTGFNTENLLTMHVHLSGPRYTQAGPKRAIDVRVIEPQVEIFYEELMAKVRAIPGVRTASLSSWIPKSYTGEGKRDRDFEIEGRPTEPGHPHPNVGMYNMVSPEYLETLQIPLQRGRFLDVRDSENAPWAVVINESLARKFFPAEDPIGKRITVLTVPEERPREIVGISADTTERGSRGQPEMFVSFLQQPDIYPGYGTQPRLGRQLAIRTSGAMPGITEAVQRAVRELDPGQLVFDVKTMRQRIVDQYDGATFISVFLSGFAVLALLLAAIGIYGVMSYTVAQRRHEIGIRIALGADRARILRLVWWHGMKLTVAGVIVAAVLSAALHRVLVWLTFGVSTSPATLLYAAAAVFCAAFLATAIPSRRATAVDAARALRSE